MQIDVKELEHCKYLVNYQMESDRIFNKRNEIVNMFRSKAPVSGFRPGKATNQAVLNQYSKQIDEALKRALAEDAYHDVLFEKKFKPHGSPKVNSLLLTNNGFNCEFEIYTRPNFPLNQYKGLEIVKPHQTLTVSQVAEEMMQELRLRLGDIEPFKEDDFIQSKDNVIIDYECHIDGQLMEKLSKQGDLLTVGSGQLNEFDSNLLGMKQGESREFDIKFDQQTLPSVAGKTAHFKVTFQTGTKNIPCGLDDAMAAKLNKSSFEELKQGVVGSATARIADIENKLLFEAVAAKLIEAHQIAVPRFMSLSEAQYLVAHAKIDWNELPDVDKEKYVELSEKNVKLSLILEAIRETDPEAQLSETEVLDVIKQNVDASKIEKTVDELIQDLNKAGQLAVLFSKIRDEHVMNLVVRSVKIVE